MKKLGGAALIIAALFLAGCGASEAAPSSTVIVTVTETPAPAPTVTVTVEPEAAAPPAAGSQIDLATDAGLCAADAEMTNLELNDAVAPLLGFPGDRDARTFDQDEAIREYKNAAFLRECPARAS